MPYSVVGTVGAVSVGGAAAALTPTWDASETRTAGNLLICQVSGWSSGTATVPSTPSGWSTAVAPLAAGARASAIFYAIATGGDTAPTISAATGMTWAARVFEVSGNATVSPVDKTGSVDAGASPAVVTASGVDVASGEFVCYVATEKPALGTATMASTPTNFTANDVTNNATSTTTNHYLMGWGITTAHAVADKNSIVFDAGSSNCAVLFASFLLAPAAAQAAGGVSHRRLRVLRGLRDFPGMRAYQPVSLRYLADSQSGNLIFGGSAAESSGVPAAAAPSDVTRLSVLRGIRNLAGMRRYQPVALKYRVDAQSGTLIFGGSAAEGVLLPAAKQPVSDITQLSVLRGVRNPVAMRRYQPAALKYTVDAGSGTLVFGGSAVENVVVPASPPPVSNTTRLSVLRGVRSPQGMRAFQPAALSYRVDAQSGTLLFAGSSAEVFTPPPAPAPLQDVTQLSVSRGIRNVAGMRRYQPAQVTYRSDAQTGNLLFGGSAVSSTGRTDAQSGNLIFGGSALEYWTPPTPVPPLSNVTQLSVTRGVRNTVGMRRYQPAALSYRLDARSGNLIFGGSGFDTYLPPGGPPSPFTPTVGIAAFIKVGTS